MVAEYARFNREARSLLASDEQPSLRGWLQERGISQLFICGITTNHCCETTARMGGNLGYDVEFVLDATHTLSDTLSLHDALPTAVNLDGEFAKVVTTAGVLEDA